MNKKLVISVSLFVCCNLTAFRDGDESCSYTNNSGDDKDNQQDVQVDRCIDEDDRYKTMDE